VKKPDNVVEFRDWHVYNICARMRQDEVEQYEALVGKFNEEVAARGFINLPGVRFTLVDDNGIPIIVGGYYEIGTGVWQSWMAGSMEGWSSHWRSITKASRWLMERLFETGARRLQTIALADRTKTREWYERSLKLIHDGTWEGHGNAGETVVTYGLTRRQFYGQHE
jgi:hypothetical protein